MIGHDEDHWRRMIGAVIAASFWVMSSLNVFAAPPEAMGPLEQHIHKMLTGDGQWRAPNPEYEPGGTGPKEFGLRFRLSPDKSHVTGEVSGVYEDGREVTYHSMIAMYNPVTEQVITEQVSWNGALTYGENPVQTGDRQIIDMVEYSPDGSIKLTRHESHFVGADIHESNVYDRGPNGAWTLKAQWTWRRHEGN